MPRLPLQGKSTDGTKIGGRRDRKEKEDRIFSGCDRGNQEERDDVCGRLHS